MMTLAGALRFLLTGSEKKRETFKVKAGDYKLSGRLDDRDSMLLLRDFIARECAVRGYVGAPDMDFVEPYDIDDIGVTE